MRFGLPRSPHPSTAVGIVEFVESKINSSNKESHRQSDAEAIDQVVAATFERKSWSIRVHLFSHEVVFSCPMIIIIVLCDECAVLHGCFSNVGGFRFSSSLCCIKQNGYFSVIEQGILTAGAICSLFFETKRSYLQDNFIKDHFEEE